MTMTSIYVIIFFALVAVLPAALGQIPNERPLFYPANLFGGKWCVAHTDIHYHTFDHAYFDYQGLCKHLLTGICDRNSKLPHFKVYLKGEMRPYNLQDSYPLYVEIHYHGYIVRLTRKLPYNTGVVAKWKGGSGSFNTISYTMSMSMSPSFEVTFISPGYKYTGPPGLTVYFIEGNAVFVHLDRRYYNSTCGMCGNYNDQSVDDYCTSAGVCPSTGTDIGNSWVVYDPEDPAWRCARSLQKRRRKRSTIECNKAWLQTCTDIVTLNAESVNKAAVQLEIDECVYDACHANTRGAEATNEFAVYLKSINDATNDKKRDGGLVSRG